MRVKVKKTKQVMIILDEREAELLRGMMQNSICEDEPKEGRDLRISLFDELNDC